MPHTAIQAKNSSGTVTDLVCDDTTAALQTEGLIQAKTSGGTITDLVCNDSTSALKATTIEHDKVHAGDYYSISGFTTMAADAVLQVIMEPPNTTEWDHLLFAVDSTNILTYELIEGATYTGGTTLTAINSNRNSANVSGTSIFIDPTTVTAIGTTIDCAKWGAVGRGTGTAAGGNSSRSEEKVIKQGEKTLFRMTSGAAGNIVSWHGSYYEHTDIA